MRQTTQAVALLLATANASYTNAPQVVAPADGVQGAVTRFTTKTTTPLQGDLMSSRTARYFNYKKATNQFTWDTSGITYQVAKVAQTAAITTSTAVASNQGCIKCMNAGGVWCSRTFSYQLSTTNPYQYTLTANGKGMDKELPNTDATYIGGAYDGGSCCNSQENMVKLAGNIGVVGTILGTGITYAFGTGGASPGTSNQAAGVTNVAQACVANKNTSSGSTASTGTVAFGKIDWDVALATAYSSWWCSNGMYKQVTSATAGVSNTIQLFGYNSNQRRELAMVGCPQKADICGVNFKADLDSTTPFVAQIANTVTMEYSDKCTWVVASYKYAPTFVVGKVAGGIVSDIWQLHHMEYTTTGDATDFSTATGSLSSKFSAGSNDGFILGTEGVVRGNFVPRFDMPANQFATLRTWYGLSENVQTLTAGDNTYGAQYSSWFTPGNSGLSNIAAVNTLVNKGGSQFYGNVATISDSTYIDAKAAALTGTAGSGNYGLVNTNVKFDFRQVRYVPAAVVQSVYSTGSALATSYNAEVTSYNTAKTVWNNYVAILSKNAKMDAFAAAFSPPKAPTVPPLPNLPWTPKGYSGFLKQTTLQATNFAKNTGAFNTSAQPASNQFWTSLDAAQSIGGWGSWTAQIMTYREGWGKSFGTIGFSADVASSFVWNNDWMCIDATAADNLACAPNKITTPSGSTVDAPAQTVAARVSGEWNVSGVAGSAQFVTVVSLWALGDKSSTNDLATAVWKTKSDVKITFTGATWSNTIPKLTGAITYSTKPTAADSLTGIAGAQALAVSSAAVLALAALY